MGGAPAPTRPAAQLETLPSRTSCRPQWIMSVERASQISGCVKGVPPSGRCNATYSPSIGSGNSTTSLFSIGKDHAVPRERLKSVVDASAVAGP
jgi:hypothetical protein